MQAARWTMTEARSHGLGKLYSTKRWRERRARQLAREPLCRFCAAQGRITPATVADHITPHRGDVQAFWTNELQSLCQSCHSGAKQQLESTGRLRGCDAQGNPLDPSHHWQG